MVELRNLQKIIDQRTVVDVEELVVKAGEVVGLFGPADSGLAPLFDLLIGRLQPSAGRILLAGTDPAAEKARFSRKVGVLFADDAVYINQTPLSNLTFYARLYGLPKSRAGEILAEVGLADHATVRAGKLSASLKRRLAFGRTTLHDPQVLLLVDPFANCDDATISLLSKMIRQKADDGLAVLILAESNSHLTTLCDALCRLEQGRIVEISKPAEERDGAMPFKIPVRLEDSVALVSPSDILYALIESGRTYLQLAERRLPTQFTMTELEERLARSGFFRAHRGYLVNLQHVQEVIPFSRSSYSLKLNNAEGTLIPLSKEAARELRGLLGY